MRCLLQSRDAVDNGINTNLFARVGRLNLDWIDPDQSSEKENEAFDKAMALSGSKFLDDDWCKSWRMQAVTVAPDKYESRMPLPSHCRGLRDDELSKEAGMCSSIVMLLALVSAAGHNITTTDCYMMIRVFIQTFLLTMGITATVIDHADIGGLKRALDEHNVTLFLTDFSIVSFLRCVDIKLGSKLCHEKGALVCNDGTFATPLNQKNVAYMIIRVMMKHIHVQQQDSIHCGCLKFQSIIRR